MNRIDPTGMRDIPPTGPPPRSHIGILPFSAELLFRLDIITAIRLQADAAEERAEQLERLSRLLEKAIEAAEDMAANSETQKEKETWSRIAYYLQSWADDPGSIEFVGSLPDNALAQLVEDFDEKDENRVELKLKISEEAFFGGDYNEVELVGALIHEAAHAVFGERGKLAGLKDKEMDMIYKNDLYLIQTEAFAYNYLGKYFKGRLSSEDKWYDWSMAYDRYPDHTIQQTLGYELKGKMEHMSPWNTRPWWPW